MDLMPYSLNESVINVFLKIFRLKIEEGQDVKPGKVLEIISGKDVKGKVIFEEDTITIEANTELGELNASYSTSSSKDFSYVNEGIVYWNVPINYTIKKDSSCLIGSSTLVCENSTNKGFQTTVFNQLEHYVDKEIQSIIKVNSSSFSVETYRHRIDTIVERVEMKPFDIKQGYIVYCWKAKDETAKEAYMRMSCTGVSLSNDEKLKDMFQTFHAQGEYGREQVVLKELHPVEVSVDGEEYVPSRVAQMGRLMGELEPYIYTLIGNIQSTLNLGKISLLDGLINSSLELQDDEFQALFGIRKNVSEKVKPEKKMDFKPVEKQ